MVNLVTSRRERRRMQLWPVAEGQGKDARQMNHYQGEEKQTEEARKVIATARKAGQPSAGTS